MGAALWLTHITVIELRKPNPVELSELGAEQLLGTAHALHCPLAWAISERMGGKVSISPISGRNARSGRACRRI